MKTTRKPARICASIFASILALTITGANPASAHEKTKTPRTAHLSSKSVDAVASLNLLGAPREGTRTVRVHSMGNGSYVCSPAGLGRKSRCSRN
ncbi:hypothetical protein SAMN05421759_107102 [Roseivivax lentus]|uniref:Uncharacterized protein n=1 Tax=Roseivivax lentus TaxID=633194 RepID=A0A1N7N9X1_9RHOB|nr:hypothetical protein [Roseivivax lentus]SIS94991.1 hypothetical protein SAMN05421759_107102 [Roseivivax lentus]